MPRLTRSSRDRRIFFLDPGGPSATGHRGDEACKEEEKTWAKQLPKEWESKELTGDSVSILATGKVAVSSGPAPSQEPRDKNINHILFFLIKKTQDDYKQGGSTLGRDRHL